MADLAQLIDDFLSHAPPEQRRDLRARLAHIVASPLAIRDAADLAPADVHALVVDLHTAGLSGRRTGEVVDALRRVFAHAVEQGAMTASPLVGFSEDVPPAAASPTTAVLALGEQVATWTVRLIALGFVLAAVALVLALA